MMNAAIYHLEDKGVDLDDIGVARHQYVDSSAQHAYGVPRALRVCPALADSGQIECAGNAGPAIVSVERSMVNLDMADHEPYIIYRGSAYSTIAMKDNCLTRIRRLHSIGRCRHAAGSGSGDNLHRVSDKKGSVPMGVAPSDRRHGPVLTNTGGDRIGRFWRWCKESYICFKNRVIIRVGLADGTDAASNCVDMALESILARGNVDGQTVAGHETDGSSWEQMPIYPDVGILKTHANSSSPEWHNWGPTVYILACFKHYNIQPLRVSDGISPIEQKHREVCSATLAQRMSACNIWGMQ